MLTPSARAAAGVGSQDSAVMGKEQRMGNPLQPQGLVTPGHGPSCDATSAQLFPVNRDSHTVGLCAPTRWGRTAPDRSSQSCNFALQGQVGVLEKLTLLVGPRCVKPGALGYMWLGEAGDQVRLGGPPTVMAQVRSRAVPHHR